MCAFLLNFCHTTQKQTLLHHLKRILDFSFAVQFVLMARCEFATQPGVCGVLVPVLLLFLFITALCSASDLVYYGNAPQLFFAFSNYTSGLHIVFPSDVLAKNSEARLSFSLWQATAGQGALLDAAVQFRTSATPPINGTLVSFFSTTSSNTQQQYNCSNFRLRANNNVTTITSNGTTSNDELVTCLFDGSNIFFPPMITGEAFVPSLQSFELRAYPQRSSSSSSSTISASSSTSTSVWSSVIVSFNGTSSESLLIPYYSYYDTVSFANAQSQWPNVNTANALAPFSNQPSWSTNFGSSSSQSTTSIYRYGLTNGDMNAPTTHSLKLDALTTSLQGTCALSTLEVFRITRISLGSSLLQLTASEDCNMFVAMRVVNVAAAQALCQSDDLCLGFTTTYVATLNREVLLCMYRRDASVTTPTTYTSNTQLRLWYQKQSETISGVPDVGAHRHNCSFVATQAGDVSVYAIESNYDYGVFVNGFFVAGCGVGSSSTVADFVSCGSTRSCATFTVDAGSTISVVPLSRGLSSFSSWCPNFDVRIIVNMTTGGTGVAVVPPDLTIDATMQYIRGPTMNAVRMVRFPLTGGFSGPYLFVKFYGLNVFEFVLDVDQTVLAPPPSTSPACSFPDPACSAPAVEYFITAEVKSVLDSNIATCGYQVPFVNDTFGSTNQCEYALPCSDLFLNPHRSTLPRLDEGFLTLGIDTTNIVSLGQRCQTIAATWRLRTSSASTSAIGGFPLVISSWRFRPVLVVPEYVNGQTNVAALFFNGTMFSARGLSLANIALKRFNTDATPAFSTAYFFTNATTLNGTFWNPEITVACVMDTVSMDIGYCAVAVPTQSRRMTVRVEDAVYASFMPQNIINVSLVRRDGTVGATRQCGDTGFLDKAGVHGNCGAFRLCDVEQFNPGEYSHAIISVPQSVSFDNTCPFAFHATVEFTHASFNASECTGFTCRVSQECLPDVSLVCDGVTDCADRSDESQCLGWYLLEESNELRNNATSIAAFNADSAASGGLRLDFVEYANVSVHSFDACRAQALIARVNLFSINATACVLFNMTFVAQPFYSLAESSVFFSLQSYVVPNPAGRVYGATFGPSQNDHCSRDTTCSGNGESMRNGYGDCACVCDAGYEGTYCQQRVRFSTSVTKIMVQISSAFVMNMSAYGFDSNFSLALETAMATVFDISEVACGVFLPLQLQKSTPNASTRASTVSTQCVDANGNGFNANILRSLVLNTSLLSDELNQFPIHSIQAATEPGLEVPPACAVPLDVTAGTTSCLLQGPVNLSHVSVATTLTSSSILASPVDIFVTLNATLRGSVGSSSRRIGGGGVTSGVLVAVNCSDPDFFSSMINWGSQVQLGCAIRTGATLVNITSIDVNLVVRSTGLTVSPSAIIQSPIIAWQRQLPVPDMTVQLKTNTVFVNYRPFLFSGLGLIGGGVLMICIAVALARRFQRDVAAVLEPVKQQEESKQVSRLGAHIKSLFHLMAYDQHTQATSVRKDRASFLLILVMINFWIAGIFLVLIWYTGTGLSSNTWIMVERYTDSSCDASLLSPLPVTAFYADDQTSTDCTVRTLFGSTAIPLYFAGWCFYDPHKNVTVAQFRVGATEDACFRSPVYEARPSVCLASNGTTTPTRTMWFGTAIPDLSFVKFTCGVPASVSSRFVALKQLDSLGTPTADVVVTTPALRLRQTLASNLTSNDSHFVFPVVRGSTYEEVHSYAPFRVESKIVGDALTSVATQLLIQVPEDTFEDSSVRYNDGVFFHNATAQLESTNIRTLSAGVTAAAQPYVVNMRELSAGMIYNGFNTSHAAAGELAGPESSKYFGVQYSYCDLGYFVNPYKMKDAEGYTITMYMRATLATTGFAFAVTDGYIDAVKSSSPLLDTLLAVIRTSGDSTSWFDEDYHVYSALHVDGPSKRLSFMYATPSTTQGAPVTNRKTDNAVPKALSVLKWDINALGLLRLFNGVWHSVTIILRMENSQLKAQLIVDGETSLSAVGWNLCVMDDVHPIASLRPGYSAKGFNASSDRFYTGGILWSGYMNGGIAELEFLPGVTDTFAIWKQSAAIRQHNQINRRGYLYLGYVMLAIAAVGVVAMIFTSGKEMYEASAKAALVKIESLFFRYVHVVRKMQPDEEGTSYLPLKYTSAKRWLQLTDTQLGQFLDELQQSTSDIAKELFRVLYLVRDAVRRGEARDIHQPLPSAAEWNQLLEEDEVEYIASKSWSFLGIHHIGAPEEDPYDIHLFKGTTGGGGSRNPLLVGEGSMSISPRNNSRSHASPKSLGSGGGEENEEGLASGQGESSMNNSSSNQLASSKMERLMALRMAEANNKRSGDVGGVSTERMNLGGGGGGAATGMKQGAPAGGGTGEFAIPVEFKQFILPVTTVLQEVYVWMSSGPIAQAYQTYFKNFFSFISLDVVEAFNEIPPLVTPLVQMFLGLLAFTALMYLTAMDEYRFSWYVAQYALKRDTMTAQQKRELDFVKDENSDEDDTDKQKRKKKQDSDIGAYCADVHATFSTPFGAISPCPVDYRVHILTVKDSMAVDRFLGLVEIDGKSAAPPPPPPPSSMHRQHSRSESFRKRKSLEGGSATPPPTSHGVTDEEGLKKSNEVQPPPASSADEATLDVQDDAGRIIVLTRTEKTLKAPPEERCGTVTAAILSAGRRTSTPSDGANLAISPSVLDMVGVRCRRHTKRRLAPVIQTDVWPFVNPAKCCVVSHGNRCNTAEGVLYVCGDVWAASKDGEYDTNDPNVDVGCRCDYAICERHYRGSVTDGIFADVLAMVRTAEERGAEWVLTTVLIMVANAAYTPFLKTALMILACHPSFQCVFTHCHDMTDQTYLLAAFLCGVVVFFFGLGLPFSQSIQLRRRIGMMREIFFARQYERSFDEETLEEKEGKKLVMSAAASSLNMSRVKSDRNEETSLMKATSVVSVAKQSLENHHDIPEVTEGNDDGEKHDEDAADYSKRNVSNAEWGRFLSSDPTVLGALYKTLEFDWIYLTPIILLWKVVLMCPAVFLPSGTFQQTVGISAAEVAFGSFMFITAPFIAPMVDLMYRVGSVHQVAFLGLQSLDYVTRYDGDTAGYGTAMIFLTFGYLCFSISCILWTVVGPQITKARDTQESTRVLQQLGFQFTMATSLYVVPTTAGVEIIPKAATAPPAAVQKVQDAKSDASSGGVATNNSKTTTTPWQPLTAASAEQTSKVEQDVMVHNVESDGDMDS